MKQISWEKFNEEEEEDEENPQEMPGIVLSQLSQMNPNVNSYDDFNFFIAHCNFYINADIVNFLCRTEGIEALDILSPYRFRIAIGKLFATQEILDNIEAELTKEE